MVKGYVEEVAAVHRPRSFWMAIPGAGLLFLAAWASYYLALEPLPLDASEGYMQAVRAARFGSMGWALFYAMLGLWVVARVARGGFGLPPARHWGTWFTRARNTSTALLLFFLSAGSCEPVASPHGYDDTRWVLGGAAGLVWLFFAIDLVPIVGRALASLGARVSALGFKRSTVGGNETGAVRIEGAVAIGERTVEGGSRPGKLVYRQVVAEDRKAFMEVSDFMLADGGHRLFVDVASEKTIVVPAETGNTEIGEGDTVEVWGHITRPEQAYRGQPSRMSAGDHRLFVFQGSRSLNRRLVQAAAVELAAAASLVAVGVTFLFYVFDLYLFLI